MLGVRSNAAPPPQDENAMSSLCPLRSVNKENGEGPLGARGGARAFGAPVSGGKAGVQPLGAAPRRALGNITNATSSKSQQLAGDGPAGKAGGKEAPVRRRAFAELTNAAAAGPTSSGKGGFGGGAKPLQQLQPASLGSRAVQSGPLGDPSLGKLPSSSKAELFAQDGVEGLAGKAWAQLEVERRQREMAGVQQRVKAVLGSTSFMRPSLAFSIPADSSSDDDDNDGPAPSSVAPPPVARRGMFVAAPLATWSTAGDAGLLLRTPSAAGGAGGLADGLPDLPGLGLSPDLAFDFDDDSDDHLLL